MNKTNKKSDAPIWMSLSDMMTGLMLVFLLIAVVSIVDVKEQQEKQNEIVEEYQNTKVKIFNDLNKTFKNDFNRWGITLSDDLTISFINPDLLFGFDSSDLRKEYQNILDSFIPKYLSVINKEEYSNAIREVRIEGYTSSEGRDSINSFMYNISLSQERSNSVLSYILVSDFFKNLNQSDSEKIKFWLSANGLGYSRVVDKDGDLVFFSKKTQDPQKSRRVEFRILTNSDELIEKIIN
jgi:outer membrane protein OmpA-like peptidoglycan-associated protein